MIDLLKRINPQFKEIHQTEIKYGDGRKAWQVTIVTQEGLSLSGGFGLDLDQARKIAAAEFLERSLVCKFKQDEMQRKRWNLCTFPTACGFAAGFNRETTKLRSILEGLERWVLSQWIDHHWAMDPVTALPSPMPPSEGLSDYFMGHFVETRFFKKSIPIALGDKWFMAHVGAVVCFTENGAFPGYSAHLKEEEIWPHALLEAFRHLLISKNSQSQERFPYNRIFHFAQNRALAEKTLCKMEPIKWPVPEIVFFHDEEYDSFYLARTIFMGWRSWSEGPVDRFLY